MYIINDKLYFNTETCIKILQANGFQILDNLTGVGRAIGIDALTLVLINTNVSNDNNSISRDEIIKAIITKGSKIYTSYTNRLEKALIAQDYVKLSIGERRKAEDEVTICNRILNRLIFITGLRMLIIISDSAKECISNFSQDLPLINNLGEDGVS